ncbi:MAG: diguanylate cyclase [Candidatus Omnitrophica bacterium]|nr:diguanylate cyclase [Candidatus Omnitrophota bacterium]
MKGLFKKLSIVPKGMRYKLLLAFSLMSIIPLLVLAYLASIYIFPQLENIMDVSTVVILSITIAILGLVLAKGFIDPVIDMAIEARVIASGEYDKKIAVRTDDEIGHLGESINIMTQRIRSNLDELKSYGQKTREINLEIHKKVLALSSLLQIGDIISAGSMELNTLLELAIQKAATIFDTGFCIFYREKDGSGDLLPAFSYNVDKEKLGDLTIRAGQGLLGRTLQDSSTLLIDEGSKRSNDIEVFKTTYNVKNMVAIPLLSGKKILGMLVIGTRLDDLRYKIDDIDLIKVFAKQMAIAIENDLLIKKTQELTIKDDLTDLYNKTYIFSRLEEEIKRAIFYQRPCSFIIFNIDTFSAFREANGELAAEEALKKMAKVIRDNLDPVGKLARIGGDEFAMLLPEKNKRETMHIAEEIRKKIESTNFLREAKASLTVSGGVSENPIDGATREELFKKAQDALHRAKALGKNRVEA